MTELINYKSFIKFLNENNLLSKELPTKTIYKRIRKILILTTSTLTCLKESTFPLLSNFSVLMMAQINDQVNIPFFGYDAISITFKKEKGKFVAYIEKKREKIFNEFPPVFEPLYGKL